MLWIRIHVWMGPGVARGDAVFDAPGGGKVLIDPKSLRLLDGIVLDYDTSLLSKGILIDNPRAESTCGVVDVSEALRFRVA